MLTSHGSVSELVNFSSGDGAAMEMVRDLIERIYSEGVCIGTVFFSYCEDPCIIA